MSQAPHVCSADPRGLEHLQAMSTGLPSPPHPPRDQQGPEVNGAVAAMPAAREPSSAATPRWAPSPQLSRREILLVALAGVLLAVLRPGR